MNAPRTIDFRVAIVAAIVLMSLAGTRLAHGQADIGVELSHIQRLNEEGRWIEALEETGRLMQGMTKQPRNAGPVANTFYTFATLRAHFAVQAGDLETAEKAIKEADGIGNDMGFRRLLAAMAPSVESGTDEALQARREYEAGVLRRDFALDDARALRAILAGNLDEAEELTNINFQKRRGGGGSGRLLAERGINEFAIISPQTLAALSTLEPCRRAVILYLKRQQTSRARTYLIDAQNAANAVIRDAFPRDAEGIPIPEWPANGVQPSQAQREAVRVRAVIAELRGAVEAAEGNLEGAEAAFGEAIDLWRRGYDTDHPEALPALIQAARIAVDRADQAKQRRDVRTAASRAKKAQRFLGIADQLLSKAIASNAPQRAEVAELNSRISAFDVSSSDLSAMEVAERAAREALRSLSKYRTTGSMQVVRPAGTSPPATPN